MRFLFAIVAMIAFARFVVVAYKTGFCSTAKESVFKLMWPFDGFFR